jgi:predicted nucleic acid-binding protein
VRFQVFRHGRDPGQGYDRRTGSAALANLQSNLDAGALVVVPADWAEVFDLAERISARHTIGGGHRFLDVLHVATAKSLGASMLLSFDANQRRLAEAEGLTAKP